MKIIIQGSYFLYLIKLFSQFMSYVPLQWYVELQYVKPDHWCKIHKNVERCDVSLTRETTNTKHTHKRSEAQ